MRYTIVLNNNSQIFADDQETVNSVTTFYNALGIGIKRIIDNWL